MSEAVRFETFDNPAGFIEIHFVGVQTPDSVIGAVQDLVKRAKKLKQKRQKAYILADVSGVPKIDISGKMARARQEAVKAMSTANYDKIAVYGNVAVQIMVNTLVLIAGKRDKIKVFSDRVEAIKWLKS